MKQYTCDEARQISLPIYYEQNETMTYQDSKAFQLIFISSGTAIIELNEKKMVLMAPTVICISEQDTLHILEAQDLQAQGVYFDPIIVNDVLSIDSLRDDSLTRTDSEYRDYFLLLPFLERGEDDLGIINLDPLSAQRFLRFLNALELELSTLSNNFWRCRTRSIFLEMLFFLQYLWTGKAGDSHFEIYEDSAISKQVLLYLHTHYDKKLTLKDLTDQFHINRTTLSEAFYKTTQMSVMAYLIKLRVYMASIMIKNTDLPITEIMYRTGFNDNSHFGRMFKKHTGCSPTAYRIGL